MALAFTEMANMDPTTRVVTYANDTLKIQAVKIKTVVMFTGLSLTMFFKEHILTVCGKKEH